MNNPITPEYVYMVHKEKERELERQIEMNRKAREQGSVNGRPSRTSQAAAWMRERVLRRAAEPQVKLEEPCPTVPC